MNIDFFEKETGIYPDDAMANALERVFNNCDYYTTDKEFCRDYIRNKGNLAKQVRDAANNEIIQWKNIVKKDAETEKKLTAELEAAKAQSEEYRLLARDEHEKMLEYKQMVQEARTEVEAGLVALMTMQTALGEKDKVVSFGHTVLEPFKKILRMDEGRIKKQFKGFIQFIIDKNDDEDEEEDEDE